ncbi:MAG: hypothetical protein J0J10_25275 [Bosea sp.]|uniref:hypothetical protein n=1 Tax=Bosea sp. (in: a-proteobacteria) TaxID=1871050 RepID=UPI001AD1D183|nr:hypothetical protein [Bosea sp. (in: a-proteobacteria)]MBN9472081.1 hypothetical protein [Bosea sp. (in: a-proteobacteria)]
MARLGTQQLRLLCGLGSPGTALVVPDRISNSLVTRGLLRNTHPSKPGMQRITPAGLRQLADDLEAGRLDQFTKFPLEER